MRCEISLSLIDGGTGFGRCSFIIVAWNGVRKVSSKQWEGNYQCGSTTPSDFVAFRGRPICQKRARHTAACFLGIRQRVIFYQKPFSNTH